MECKIQFTLNSRDRTAASRMRRCQQNSLPRPSFLMPWLCHCIMNGMDEHRKGGFLFSPFGSGTKKLLARSIGKVPWSVQSTPYGPCSMTRYCRSLCIYFLQRRCTPNPRTLPAVSAVLEHLSLPAASSYAISGNHLSPLRGPLSVTRLAPVPPAFSRQTILLQGGSANSPGLERLQLH